MKTFGRTSVRRHPCTVSRFDFIQWGCRCELSGQLDYTDRNHIEKGFQTVTMRIDRFHAF